MLQFRECALKTEDGTYVIAIFHEWFTNQVTFKFKDDDFMSIDESVAPTDLYGIVERRQGDVQLYPASRISFDLANVPEYKEKVDKMLADKKAAEQKV